MLDSLWKQQVSLKSSIIYWHISYWVIMQCFMCGTEKLLLHLEMLSLFFQCCSSTGWTSQPHMHALLHPYIITHSTCDTDFLFITGCVSFLKASRHEPIKLQRRLTGKTVESQLHLTSHPANGLTPQAATLKCVSSSFRVTSHMHGFNLCYGYLGFLNDIVEIHLLQCVRCKMKSDRS